MARVLEVLPGASKQLQQNALLDVIILIDTGGCGTGRARGERAGDDQGLSFYISCYKQH